MDHRALCVLPLAMAPTILSLDGPPATFSSKSDFLLFCFGIGTLLASLIGLFGYVTYCFVRFLLKPGSRARKWFTRKRDTGDREVTKLNIEESKQTVRRHVDSNSECFN